MNFTTILKYGALLGLGLFAFTAGTHAAPSAPSAIVVTTSAILTALVPVMWTYDGWSNLSFIGGEVKDPGRNMPRALILGTAAIVLIYLIVNAAYLYLLPVPEMAAAERVAATRGDADPDVRRGGCLDHRRDRDGLVLRVGERLDHDRPARLLRDERSRPALPAGGARLAALQDAVGGDLARGRARRHLRAAEFLRAAGRALRARHLAVLRPGRGRRLHPAHASAPTCRDPTAPSAIRSRRRSSCWRRSA